MSLVYADLSMSLDGFIAGSNVSVDNPLGDGGERLHDWMFAGRTTSEVEEFEAERFSKTGALIMGRTMLDVGIGPWGDDPPFHAPVFVVTHRPTEPVVKAGGTTYTFITDGPAVALERAQDAADGQEICVAGGATVVQHYLRAGVIHELRMHVIPILLGEGVRLFTNLDNRLVELAAAGNVDSSGTAHLVYRIRR